MGELFISLYYLVAGYLCTGITLCLFSLVLGSYNLWSLTWIPTYQTQTPLH